MKKFRWRDLSLVSKILTEVGLIAGLLFALNLMFYVRINDSMQKMDNVYASNAQITQLAQVFENVQDSVYQYLKVKSSQALMDYYQNEAKYRAKLEKLNDKNVNNSIKLLEKNIREMSETYLDYTAETVLAKRGRNVEKYKSYYAESLQMYRYLNSYISQLNVQQFKNNTASYRALQGAIHYLEVVSSVVLVLMMSVCIIMLFLMVKGVISPLTGLAATANLVGQGNFNVKMPPTDAQDEVGVVTRAFNTMVSSLKGSGHVL